MKKQWPSSECDNVTKAALQIFEKNEHSYSKTNKIRHILEKKIFQNKRLLPALKIFLKDVFKFIVN